MIATTYWMVFALVVLISGGTAFFLKLGPFGRPPWIKPVPARARIKSER